MDSENRTVSFPGQLLVFLIVGIACVSGDICPDAAAQKQFMTNARIGRTDRTVHETGVAIASEDRPRKKTVLVLHTLKVKRPWNLLFNRYSMEALEQSDLPPPRIRGCGPGFATGSGRK